MRTLTIDEYIAEELNKLLADRDVQIVSERPKPTLVTDNVVKFREQEPQQAGQ
jgi:hypothetical protein